jgi:hypothetical protein
MNKMLIKERERDECNKIRNDKFRKFLCLTQERAVKVYGYNTKL